MNLNATRIDAQDRKDIHSAGLLPIVKERQSQSFHECFFEINDEHEWSTQLDVPKTNVSTKQTIHHTKRFQNPFKMKHEPRRSSLQNTILLEDDIIFIKQEETTKNVGPIHHDRPKSVGPTLLLKCVFEPLEQLVKKKSISKNPQIELKQSVTVVVNTQQQQDEQQFDREDDDDDKEMTEEEAKKAALYRWAKENIVYTDDKNYDDIMTRVKNFKIIDAKDEPRTEAANKDGGKQCKNKKMVKTIRAIGKQIIKEIGKKVLSGNFNLTSISFPIRVMIPKSALEKALQATCLFPLYINRAAQIVDPVERIKLIICATIGNFYINCSFLKPLNPILGESIQATYADGTQLYAEQIAHHPPMSYFCVYGANNSYKFYGYYNYEANAGLNSLTLKNRGKRSIQFHDGQMVEYDFASEEYCGSFWGPMKLEATGKMTFTDKVNKITAEMQFDNVRWKPTDYFQGEIKRNGKRVSKIYGSYMGFIEFDNLRYWDFRYVHPYQFQIQQQDDMIESDHQHRLDRKLLLKSKVEEAQVQKDILENQQRLDTKNRNDYKKTYTKK